MSREAGWFRSLRTRKDRARHDDNAVPQQQTVIVHLDEPAGAVTASSVHVRGWAAGERPANVVVHVNGRPVRATFYERPDVVRAFPDRDTSGFSAFVTLSDLGNSPSVDIRISSGETTLLERQIDVEE